MTLLNNCGFQFIIGIYSLHIIMDKEYRSSEKVELRDNTIEGYACVFGKPSDPALGFTEYIDMGSITDEVVNNSDILATYEHDFKQLLARSKFGEGSLQLSIDDNGLFFRFEIPDTQLGHDLKAMIQRGDLQGCSFCFAVADDGVAVVLVERLELALCLQDKAGGDLAAADGSHELFQVRYLPDVGALVDEAAHMDGEPAAVYVVGLFTQQVK